MITGDGVSEGHPTTGTKRWRSLEFRIDRVDRWKPVTIMALVGLGLAIGMALVGLPPWDLHTPLHHAGIMDPLCGGTRSIRLAAMGRWGESWEYNPVGIPLLLIFGVLLTRFVIGVTTHRWFSISVHWTRTGKWVVISIVIVLVVLLEIRQQSIAPLLMGS